MSRTYDIAICDSTSLAGETIIRLFEEKSFPVGTLYPLSHSAEGGASVEFMSEELDVLTESGFEFADVDLVFVPAGSSVNETVLQQAIESGCMVIDGSWGAAALTGSVLALPGLNEEVLDTAVMQKRVVIPSSPAALLLTALQAINDIAAIDRIDVTACQSVSRMGNPGIDELRKQTVELLNGKPVEGKVFPHRAAYNLIPQVGTVDEMGMSAEEMMIEAEICSGLNVSGIDVRSTCVIAPVFYGDSLAVSLDMDSAVDLDIVHESLTKVEGVSLFEGNDYPTVEQAAGCDEMMVGRLRGVAGKEGTLCFWVSADAVRQGALSAVKVAEILIKDFL